MKVFLAGLVVVIGVFATIAGSYALSLHALSNSQHNWCDTLTLLTSTPVTKPANPNANPSREADYLFYTRLKVLEDRFGC